MRGEKSIVGAGGERRSGKEESRNRRGEEGSH